jgi:hypothetical protein
VPPPPPDVLDGPLLPSPFPLQFESEAAEWDATQWLADGTLRCVLQVSFSSDLHPSHTLNSQVRQCGSYAATNR